MAEKNSLWRNIRNKAKQNRESGVTPKKPTDEMLRQERKIKAKQYAEGSFVGEDEKLPTYNYANKEGVIGGPRVTDKGTWLPTTPDGTLIVNMPEFEVISTGPNTKPNPYSPVTGEEYLSSGYNPVNLFLPPQVEKQQQPIDPKTGMPLPQSGKADYDYGTEMMLAAPLAQGVKSIGKGVNKAYNTVATGNSPLPIAWKSPAIGLSPETSDDMFKTLVNSGKLSDAERAVVIDYQYNSRPFTGRSGKVNVEKRNQINDIIKKYNINADNTAIATRKFNPNNNSIGATIENSTLNFGDRPTSFSAGVGKSDYTSGSVDRIVIPNRSLKKLNKKFTVNDYGPISEDAIKHLEIDPQFINHNYNNPAATNLKSERELIGTGLNLKQVGKVKNDIGGYDWIVQHKKQAEGGFYPTQGPPKALFKGYDEGGYMYPDGGNIPKGWKPLTSAVAKNRYSGDFKGMYYKETGNPDNPYNITYFDTPVIKKVTPIITERLEPKTITNIPIEETSLNLKSPAKRKAWINRGANSSFDAEGNPLVSEVNFGDNTGWHKVPYNTLDQYEEIKATGGYYNPYQHYAQGGYTNPYNQYQDDPYLNYANGGYVYGKGGRILKNIGAGAFGILEGLVDTTFGWIPGVDQATDAVYRGLQKVGGSTADERREQDSIHGYAQTAGAVGSAILTGGATTGMAIGEAGEGLGQGISKGNESEEWARVTGNVLKIGSGVASTVYGNTGNAKEATSAFKLSNAGSTGLGKFAAAAPKSATALTAARTARAASNLDSAGNVIGNAAPEGTKIATDIAGNASSIKPSVGVLAPPKISDVSSLAPNLPVASTASAAIPKSLPTSLPSTSDYSRLEKVGDVVSSLSALPKSQEPPEMAPPIAPTPLPELPPQTDYNQFAINTPDVNAGLPEINYNNFGGYDPSSNVFSQGGNITNNSLNLRNTMRYKRFAQGGTLEQQGINFITDDAGLHYQNANGGVPIGPDALAEGGEAKLQMADGGQYIVSDQVDGANTQTINGQTMAERLKKKLKPFMMGGLASNPKDKENLRRPFDSYSAESIAQVKDNAIQETEAIRMQRGGAVQYAAHGGKLTKDIEKIVMEEYTAAYGGTLPNKYKGKVNMPNSYAKGGGIHIKPENKGKFTASAKAAGHTVQEHARAVLNNPNATPLQKKRANFARNASKWKHADGGYVHNQMTQPMYAEGGPIYGDPASEYVYAMGGMYGDPYARGGQIDYTNDMYSSYAGGGPMPSNLPQAFNGISAQNRGGMYAYPDGGMMPPQEQQMMQQQQMQQAPQEQMPQQGGQDQMMQMVEQVMQAIMQGANPEQIMQQLVQSGVPPEQAQQIIQVAMQEAQGQQQPMQEGQQPMQGQEEMMPQEMAHGGYIQYARGGKTGGVPVELTPTQEHFANEMYKRYGKVVMTDKATNETIYGTKKQDGTWDLNKFEVLTGANSTGQDMAIPLEEIEKLQGSKKHAEKKTPLGVWGLKKQDDIYGMPGYFLGNTSAAYHTTYKGKDDPNRSALYGNKNNEDNYRSYGCINCEKPSMQALLNFVGDTGFATVIDSRISPEENAKWMKQNTPSTHFKYENPKATVRPGVKPTNKPVNNPIAKNQPTSNQLFNVLPQQVRNSLTSSPVQAPRPKTEKIKQAIVKKSMASVPAPSNRNMGMAATTSRPMPSTRQAVQQPVQQVAQRQQPSDDSSIVNYLASKGQDFSKEARAQLAQEHGIANYNYTAEDNTNLLNAIKNQNQVAANGGYLYGEGGPGKKEHATGGKMYYRGGPDMPPYNPINPMVNSSSYIQDQYGLEDLYGGVDDGSHPMFITDEYGNVVRNSYRPTYNMNNLNRLKSNYFDNSNSFNPNPYLPNNQLGSYTSTNAMEPGIYDDMQRLKINPGDYPSIITNTTRPNLDRLPELPNNQLSPMPPSGPADMSIYNEDYVPGVDADGNPVSWNPAILKDYDENGNEVLVNPNTLGEDFTDTRQQVSPAGQQNQSGYKGFTVGDAAMAAAQLAGPLHQLFQKKPEPFKYQKPQYKELNPEPSIIASNQAAREAQALTDYNIKQNAPTSGSYLANIRANSIQSAKQRGAAASAIRSEYDKVNSAAYNRNQEVGADIENTNIVDRQKDLANWKENQTNALYNAGANLAGMYRDKKMQDIYKNYVAPNIGTANMGYVQDANGNWILTPKSGSNSNFQVTPPAKVGAVESPTGLTEISPEVGAAESSSSFSMPNELAGGDETKAFQDYLDAGNIPWYKGSKLGRGKGYGTFGDNTRAAYAKYKDAYGKKQLEAARLMYNIQNPNNSI